MWDHSISIQRSRCCVWGIKFHTIPNVSIFRWVYRFPLHMHAPSQHVHCNGFCMVSDSTTSYNCCRSQQDQCKTQRRFRFFKMANCLRILAISNYLPAVVFAYNFPILLHFSNGLQDSLPNPLIVWCHYFVILLRCNNQESIEPIAHSHAITG